MKHRVIIFAAVRINVVRVDIVAKHVLFLLNYHCHELKIKIFYLLGKDIFMLSSKRYIPE